jgi:hypothetical protein
MDIDTAIDLGLELMSFCISQIKGRKNYDANLNIETIQLEPNKGVLVERSDGHILLIKLNKRKEREIIDLSFSIHEELKKCKEHLDEGRITKKEYELLKEFYIKKVISGDKHFS